MTTGDLAAWLLEQIAADEATARDRTRRPHLGDCEAFWHGASYDECTCDYPARVLAECAAKRRIIELAAHEPGRKTTFRREMILQALAQPYADREGFRAEWRA